MELTLQQMEVNPAQCVLQVRNVRAKQMNQLHAAQGIIGIVMSKACQIRPK